MKIYWAKHHEKPSLDSFAPGTAANCDRCSVFCLSNVDALHAALCLYLDILDTRS